MLACAARVPRASPLGRGISVRYASGWRLEPELRSESGGVIYKLDESSVDEYGVQSPVYESSADGKKYHVQVIAHKEDFENYLSLQTRVALSPYVRVATDTIPEHQAFVYPSPGPLNLGRTKGLFYSARRRVLRDALRGLADLHDRGIVHDNLVPRAILYEDTESPNKKGKIEMSLGSVALAPDEKWVTGPGPNFNEPHRSPEAWCGARRNQASDVFAFGTLIIYAMAVNAARKLPFDVDPSGKLLFEDRWRRTILRQIAMCADKKAFEGFRAHIGSKSPFQKQLSRMKGAFEVEYQRAPITAGDRLALQPDAADLVAQMMNLDPARRITARKALQHEYFSPKRWNSNWIGAPTPQ
ncbi:hypothetical protein ASPCAL08526 [Aspergillus calidoustus]|uniref:Protein kinase domain-containing protein n=1 Tax=Aspergillus calidoustus TaxID=454130 RepID=A0A0U5GQK2_ASPCI|nr:hypothetical protein ASPCAL08526 [Aspergillus calidoustus]